MERDHPWKKNDVLERGATNKVVCDADDGSGKEAEGKAPELEPRDF